jgi:hypothetical protein
MFTPSVVSPYPANCKYAAWKAAKTDSIRDRWNLELGKALKDAEAAYNKVKWEWLDVGRAAQGMTERGKFDFMTDVDTAKKQAIAHNNTYVKAAIKALDKAQTKAAFAAKSPLTSKQATAQAKVIAAELKRRLAQLKSVKFDDFDAEKARLQRYNQQTYSTFDTKLQSAFRKADAFVDTVRDNPTAAEFNAGIKDAARNITQNIANVEKLKKNGFDLGKRIPKSELEALEDWAQERDKLPDNANQVKVMAAIHEYQRKVAAVRAWWGR